MNQPTATAILSLTLLTAATLLANRAATAQTAQAQTTPNSSAVTVARSGSRPSQQGPAENFTGSVRINPLFDPEGASDVGGASVTFEPGARTAWHTHPRGQTLIVTAGVAVPSLALSSDLHDLLGLSDAHPKPLLEEGRLLVEAPADRGKVARLYAAPSSMGGTCWFVDRAPHGAPVRASDDDGGGSCQIGEPAQPHTAVLRR